MRVEGMMKKPSDSDAQRCIGIRCNSKRGQQVSPPDHKFCMKMLQKYEEWYIKTEAMVFNLTVPFGSRAHMDEPDLD
jgi:hypothetical protein